MKYVLLLTVVAVAIFAMGCQDNNLTGPVASSSHQLLKPSPTIGHLMLKGDVTAGSVGGVNEIVFHLSGLVTYTYSIIGEGQGQYYEFAIGTQAQLVPVSPILPQGSVDNQWIYQIATAGKQGVVLVQKDYYVPDLGTKLHIIFAIAEDNKITVQSQWLDAMLGQTESKGN